MELFSRLYQSHDKGGVVEGVAEGKEEPSDTPSSVLHPQLTTPNQLQLVKSMCKILKVQYMYMYRIIIHNHYSLLCTCTCI